MAEHDGKVVFDLEIDDSKVRGDLNRALNSVKNQLAGQKAKISVEADTGTAVTQLGKVKSAAHDLESSDPTVTVKAQTASANTQLDRTKGKAADLEDTDPTVTVDAQTGEANYALDRTKSKADDLESSDPTVTVDAQTGEANSALEETKSKADDVEASDPTITVNAQTGEAIGALDDVLSRAHEIDSADPTITVNANTGEAEGALERLKSGVTQGVGMSIGNTAVGAAKSGISNIFSAGVGYDYGLAKVATLLPSGADRGALGSQILGLSAEMGVDPNILLEAAYNGLSASVDYGEGGSNLMNYLRTSSMLALGGYTDTNTAGDALTSVFNAYNGQYSNDQIANLMLKTQNKGKITVDQIAQSVAQITPAASVSGVGFDQVGAMWAALTAGGVQPAQAATQIRSVFNELNQAGSKGNTTMMAALMGTQYEGMDLSTIMQNGGTMVDVLSAIQKYADDSGLALSNFFSSSEASGAVAFLTGENQQRFEEALGYMREESDVMSDAYDTMNNTTQQSIDRIKATAQAYFAQLFVALKPFLDKIFEVLQSEKFKAAFDGIVNKLSELLSGDTAENFANAILNIINWIIDFLNDPGGTISAGIQSALEAAWAWLQGKAAEFGEWIRTSIATALEGSNAPDWIKAMFGLGGKKETETDTEFLNRQNQSAVETGHVDPLVNMFTGWYTGKKAQEAGEGGNGFTKGKGAGRTKSVSTEAESVATELESASESMSSADESASTLADSSQTAGESLTEASESAEGISTEADGVKAAMFGANATMKQVGSSAKRMSSSVSTIKSYLGSAGTAISGLPAAIQALVNAANSAAKNAGGRTVSPSYDTPKAVGLDYVPYDNYPALLHKGEMILTAAQASSFRHGGSASSGGGIDVNALASAMKGLAVEMDGRTVGRLVERSVSAQQATRLGRMS